MCLGIPGQITEIVDAERCVAIADVAGTPKTISTAMIDKTEGAENVKVGDWVLVHIGFALEVIDAEQAAESNAFLTELGGGGLDEYAFADLEPVEPAPTTPENGEVKVAVDGAASA